MALERKDVRFKVDVDVHAAITVLSEIAQVDIGEFIEMIVQREVLKRVHEANVIAERAGRLGVTGNNRDSLGVAGK